MDIKKLKKIIKDINLGEFCKFFLELEMEEILKLSEKEYNEIIIVCSKLKDNENFLQNGDLSTIIISNGPFTKYGDISFLYFMGIEKLSDAIDGIRPLENASVSKFYSDIFLSLKVEKDSYYGKILFSKGTDLQILAENGIKTNDNLSESLKYFNEALPIIKEVSDVDYAGIFINKGISFQMLALYGTDTDKNINESLECINKALTIFKREKPALYYAKMCIDQGNNLMKFVRSGIMAKDILKEVLNYINDAIPIIKEEGSELYYAKILSNKGTTLQLLAWHRIEMETNLKESMDCFEKALPIFKMKGSDSNYAEILVSMANSTRLLLESDLERGANADIKFEKMINNYIYAEDVFYKRSDFLLFVTTSVNHCVASLWKYIKTDDDIYLDIAKEIAKRALKESSNVNHSAKEEMIKLLIKIDDKFQDNYKIYKEKIYDNIRKEEKELMLGRIYEKNLVIKDILLSKRIKDVIKIAVIQFSYELIAEMYPPSLKNEDDCKEKIILTLDIAKEKSVDIACLPELCMNEKWISIFEQRYPGMIIIGGSYYKDDYNECPIIMRPSVYVQRKNSPSRSEDPDITGHGMKSGNDLFNFSTKFGTFSVLICRDFLNYLYKLPDNIDIIFCPSYNSKSGTERFHQYANNFVTNKPSYIIISNTAIYGGTSIFGQLHSGFYAHLISNKCKKQGDMSYKLCELEETFEGLIIADFDMIHKSPQLQAPGQPKDEMKSVRHISRYPLYKNCI